MRLFEAIFIMLEVVNIDTNIWVVLKSKTPLSIYLTMQTIQLAHAIIIFMSVSHLFLWTYKLSN
jgi:hypothetical protein